MMVLAVKVKYYGLKVAICARKTKDGRYRPKLMDFEKVAKYVGFILTVVSLIVAIDYFVADKKVSLGVSAIVLVVLGIILFKVRKKDPELFELRVLNHEVTIDLQDTNGELAIHSRKTNFLTLKNGITTFTDHMSADGEFTDPEVSPGVIEEIRQEGGDLFVRSNFGKVLNKGNKIEKVIRANLRNSFKDKREYWSVRIILPTEEFKLIVIFPRERPYKSYRGYRRITSHEMLCDIQPIETLLMARPALVWTVKNPVIKDVYKLMWEW